MESKIKSKIRPFFEFSIPLLEFLTPAVGNRRELQRLKEKSMLDSPSGIVGNCEAESKIESKIQFSTHFLTPAVGNRRESSGIAPYKVLVYVGRPVGNRRELRS